MGVKLSEWKLKITDGVSATMGKITALGDKAAAQYGALQDKVDRFTKGVKGAASEVPGLNRVIELVTNPYVAVAAGVVALGIGLAASAGMALGFDKKMAQVNTTAQLSNAELSTLKDTLIDMAVATKSNVPLEQIPGSFNQVLSAVGETGRALEIFEPSLKAAKAGFTDLNVVTEAAVNVMGSVPDATPTQVFDTLFATMRVGKAEFADIASYLPKILPLANNVGIKYQEIAAAFALMTGKGQTAEQSAMLLENAMTALSKTEVIYGSKSKAGFERSGIAIFDHQGKVRKLTEIVDDLSKHTTGMNDKQKQAFLSGLGLDAQAASAFSVLAQNAGDLKKFTSATTNSTGEMENALKLSANTSDRIAAMWNRVQAVMLRVGYRLLPFINVGLDLLERGFTWVSNNLNTLKAVAEGVGAGIAVVLATMAAGAIWTGVAWVASMVSSIGVTFLLQYALLAVRTALFSIPIVGWIALAVTAFVTLYQSSSRFRAVLAGIGSVLLALWDPIKLLGTAISNLFNPAAFAANMVAFVQSVRNLDLKGSFNKGYDASMAASQAAEAGGQKKTALGVLGSKVPGAVAPGAGAPGKLKDGIKAVNDGGRSVRNVIVHIHDGLVKELKIITGTGQSSRSEMEDFIKETLIRAVNGAEQALAS